MNNLFHLLQLHIEAVWYIQLNTKLAPQPDYPAYQEVGLAATSTTPPWKLCLAQPVSPEPPRIAVWRSDVSPVERASLLNRAHIALDLSPSEYRGHQEQFPGVHREVALQQVANPAITLQNARQVAHRLTTTDTSLFEEFEPGSSPYYSDPNRQPLVGVVVKNKLLCLAHSSRRTNAACELGIDTLPHARRKGYALAATITWAEAVRQEGLIPIYSALLANQPSLALAHAAGYRPFANTVTISS